MMKIEKPVIKTERMVDEERFEVSNISIDKKPLKEELEKDIPDLINVSNFANIIPEEIREVYYCNTCKNKYGKFEYLQIHEYVHDPSKHCPICNFTIKAKKDFIVHINGHVKEKMEDERRTLICDFCKKHFKKRRDLTLHLRVHTNERPYVCHTCGKAFKQKGSLTDHNNTHTNIKAFSCEICSGSFTTASSLKKHIRRIHDKGKTYFCKICSQKLDNYVCLRLHRSEQHPEVSEHRQCPLCPMVFKSLYTFRKHQEREHNDQLLAKTKYNCFLCGEKFQDHKLFVDHKDGHFYYDEEDFQKAQINGFSCKLCKRDFKNKQTLFKHMPFHMEKTEKCDICQEFFSYYGYSNHKRIHMPLKCKICKEIFEGSTKLIRHYRTAHPNWQRDGKYACCVCDKVYKSKYPLDMHMQIYHGKSDATKTHKCSICGRQFTTRAALGVHMTRGHTTGLRFKCYPCNTLFQNRSTLQSHNAIYHQGTVMKCKKIRSRLCTHCNLEFRTVSLLDHHKKTKHKVVKAATKFQCKICLKYFKSFRSRTVHLDNKVCTKFFEKTKKNFSKCAICQRNFSLRTSLINHMMVHCEFYKTCRFCNKTFTQGFSLKVHIKKLHPDGKEYYCGFCDVEFDDLEQLRIHGCSSAHSAKIDSMIEAMEESRLKNVISEEKIIKDDVEIKKEPLG